MEEVVAYIRTIFDEEISHTYCCTPEEAEDWFNKAGGNFTVVAEAIKSARAFLEKENKLGRSYMDEEVLSQIIPESIARFSKTGLIKLSKGNFGSEEEALQGLCEEFKNRIKYYSISIEEAQEFLDLAEGSHRIVLQGFNNVASWAKKVCSSAPSRERIMAEIKFNINRELGKRAAQLGDKHAITKQDRTFPL